MAEAHYKMRQHGDGWVVDHDGAVTAGYVSKEAAFEAAIGPASNAIKEGHDVIIELRGAHAANVLGVESGEERVR